MRLFIAEKPSVAKAIAAELGVTGRGAGYLECGADKVTWCFGHMFEQAEPDAYTPDDVPRTRSGKKIWRVDELPIIPKNWQLRPKADAKKQLAVISRLVREANEIVNAGDPDREGQLLVDEVLEQFRNTRPVRRFWVSAQDSTSIQRGLANLRDNTDYHGWGLAALGRGRADWLIGMNLSRAFTLRARRGGSRSLVTVGRVQTPTLALVVARDREIEAFKPVPYYTIRAAIQHQNGTFDATWKPGEEQAGLDPEGRLLDKAVADALVAAVTGQPGQISAYEQKLKRQAQPRAFSLSDITALASAKFGYSAEDVLKTCQALYETHKLTSYPRTDCAYLPESQHADAPRVLEALRQVNPQWVALIDGADQKIKSRTWDDKKISAHHGIIPTMHKGSVAELSEMERNLHELIVRAYLAQFYPEHEYLATTVSVAIGVETFAASGRTITRNGWRDVYDEAGEGGRADDSGNQTLPDMRDGDAITCIHAERKDAMTRPPPHFTEGTLIRAMENIHKFVTRPEHKKLLREGDGIGTSATRAAIIADLRRRQFLEARGKQVISTALGRSLIDVLPDMVKSPVLTALYERMLKDIEQGAAELDEFMARQAALIREQVAEANQGAVTLSGDKKGPSVSDTHRCGTCGNGLVRRPSKKNKKLFWWGCSNFPACRQTYFDIKGKPDYNKAPGVSGARASRG